jgi:hypothetical protein
MTTKSSEHDDGLFCVVLPPFRGAGPLQLSRLRETCRSPDEPREAVTTVIQTVLDAALDVTPSGRGPLSACGCRVLHPYSSGNMSALIKQAAELTMRVAAVNGWRPSDPVPT